MHLSTDNTLHGSGKAVAKSGILLPTEKGAKSNDGIFCAMCPVLNIVLAHLTISHQWFL